MDHEKINREEEKLVKDCIGNNPLAQQQLFKKYYGFVMAICLRYTGDKDEAKDILQLSFIKVFKNLESYRQEGGLKSWIKRIVVNTAIDKFRRDCQQAGKVRINEKTVIPEKETVLSDMNKEDLLKCISRLPIGYRTVFNLFVIEGYSHQEIAEKLGINEGTSKSQLFKARQILQEMIGKM